MTKDKGGGCRGSAFWPSLKFEQIRQHSMFLEQAEQARKNQIERGIRRIQSFSVSSSFSILLTTSPPMGRC